MTATDEILGRLDALEARQDRSERVQVGTAAGVMQQVGAACLRPIAAPLQEMQAEVTARDTDDDG